MVAQLAAQSPATHATSVSIAPTSGNVSGTWLGVSLVSSTTGGASGGPVSLTAMANADLSNTPWSIYIQNDAGQLIGQPCNASTCSASVTVGAHDSSRYRAIIGRVVTNDTPAPAGPSSPLNIGASSQLVRPLRVLWGVDSCKAFTDDPAGGDGLLAQATGMIGTPAFWGRYLPDTPNCPGLTGAEISAAHARHMAILPIYNNYDCSQVSSSATGSTYALAAIELAWDDHIPPGTAIAIDIEPPGDACPGAANVDQGFIEGWYDRISNAGFVPAFYGDTAAGSSFAGAWCAAIAHRPEIAPNSYLWSFEPSYTIGRQAHIAPTYEPDNAGCAGHYTVWQYSLSDGSDPDVDVDEATTDFPFWWP